MSPKARRIVLSIAGIVLGFIISGTYVNRYGGDIGFLFLPFGLIYGTGITLFLNAVAELAFGTPKTKKIAIALLATLAIVASYTVYTKSKDREHYCDGVPVSQYQGPLPTNCSY